MLKLFYTLGADPNLQQVFLSSIPKDIGQVVEISLQKKERRIVDAPIGELQQEIHLALDDLYIYQKAFRSYLKSNKELDRACQGPELKIKCANKELCDDPSCGNQCKKKKYFKRFSLGLRRKRKWQFEKRRSKRDQFERCKKSTCVISATKKVILQRIVQRPRKEIFI